MIPVLFTLSIREFPASLNFLVVNFFPRKMDAFTCSSLQYPLLYFYKWKLVCFIRTPFPGLSLQTAPPCKQQLSSIICSGVLFLFRESGWKERFANNYSEFFYFTIHLFLCTWTFFSCVYFCFFKLQLPSLLNIDGFVQCNMNWGVFIFRSLCSKEMTE